MKLFFEQIKMRKLQIPSYLSKPTPTLNNIISRMQNWTVVVHSDDEETKLRLKKDRELIKQARNMPEIINILSSMLNDNLFPNQILMTQLIRTLGELNEKDAMFSFFQIAIEKNIDDAFTYHSAIRAIANSLYPDVQRALQILELAKAKGMSNAHAYIFSITAIAKHQTPDVDLALKLLEEAEEKNMANDLTYAITLDVLFKSDRHLNEALALSLLDKATQRFQNIEMGKTEQLDLNRLSFASIYYGLKRYLTICLTTPKEQPISLALMYGKESYYKEAVMLSITDLNADTLITTEEQTENPEQLNIMIYPEAPLVEAHPLNDLIRRMKDHEITTQIDQTTLLQAYSSDLLNKQMTLDEITQLLSEMLSKNIYPDWIMFHLILNKMTEMNRVDLVLVFHQIAVEKGFAHLVIYNSTINAIAKSQHPDATPALKLLEEAEARNMVNAYTYNKTITAIANSQHPDVTCTLELLDKAKEKNKVDHLTYALTLDVLLKSDRHQHEELALSLLDKATQLFHSLERGKSELLGVNGLSFGSVYYSLKRHLTMSLATLKDQPISLTLIYEKEPDYYDDEYFNGEKRKEAVMLALEDISAKALITTEEPVDNPGQLNIMIYPEAPLAVAQVFSTQQTRSDSLKDLIRRMQDYEVKTRINPKKILVLSTQPTISDSLFSLIIRMERDEIKTQLDPKRALKAYSQLLSKQTELDEIAQLLSDMLSKNIYPDQYIFSQVINIMSTINRMDLVLVFHQMAVEKGLANVVIYSSTINAIAQSENPDISHALQLLEEAETQNMVNAVTYNSTINAIAKSKNLDITCALKSLEKAKARNMVNTVTYNSTIKAITKSKNPDITCALKLLKEAKARNMVDTIIYNSIIHAIAQSENPNVPLALALLDQAKKQKMVDALTYNSTIHVIAQSENPDIPLALALLEQAKAQNMLDAFTYSSTINAIAQSENPNVSLALELLEQAKAQNMLDAVTYSSTIHAIARSQTPDVSLALQLLNESEKKHIADTLVYEFTLNVLLKSDRHRNEGLALSLLDKIIKQFNFIDVRKGRVIDLHELSFGSAYYGLRRRLTISLATQREKPISFTLIYGKGLGTYNKNYLNSNVHPLKEAVMLAIEDLIANDAPITYKEKIDNTGILRITIHPAPPLALAQGQASQKHPGLQCALSLSKKIVFLSTLERKHLAIMEEWEALQSQLDEVTDEDDSSLSIEALEQDLIRLNQQLTETLLENEQLDCSFTILEKEAPKKRTAACIQVERELFDQY